MLLIITVAQPPAQAHQPILSKRSKWPFYATHGPSHCQFFIEAPSIPKDTSLPLMVKMANNALACAKSTLQVVEPEMVKCPENHMTQVLVAHVTIVARLVQRHDLRYELS
ncbi:hypothetical protein P691DRAFT_769134 [Macrolepiota fuliginosa MF-IS2]|uniref:Uncharacterized protein n=1 Tax=Macrolepiota fuliginosa MF-IS2 TaxID=1400762 RepID=A0A9P5WVW5_9AGAR|nr:hypothetical protein P691DRAFT_769134 [Macrolepiota fuliginosa MF-IS2]